MKKLLVLLLFAANFLYSQSWEQMAKIVALDRDVGDNFGFSVSISGGYAIVGAPDEGGDALGQNFLKHSGSAYIFKLSAGEWTQMQKIVASDRGETDYFGRSVAISGNYAIVGAKNEAEDTSGNNTLSNAGSAYIFGLSDGEWTQMQKIVASDRAEGDYFGYAVAISDKYAIVGAKNEDEDAAGENTLSIAGSAYIFELSAGEWTQMQKIVADDRNIGDNFGFSVSISNNYVIVGATYEDEDASGENTKSSSGSAYIFELSNGEWIQKNKIVASDREESDYFGCSVAISGNYAIVGAFGEDEDVLGDSTQSYSGSAYIYKMSNGTWLQMQKIVASDRDANDEFGFSVSVSGDYAIVGACYEDASGDSTLSRPGSSYIYKLSEGNWGQVQKIVSSDRDSYDTFGSSVSISGDYIIVGAYTEDEDAFEENTKSSAGSVYIFGNTASLPVELSSFSGIYTGTEVSLSWETETEVNNYGFDIERKPGSSGSWTKIGFAAGSGAENVGQSYTFADTTLPAVDTVSYRLKQIDNDGAYEYSKTVEVVINNSSVTGVDESDLPTEFGLSQNYPNPFNPTTSIEYQVSSSADVSIKVYDLVGREVATLVNGTKAQGRYRVEFDASKLASGIYIYRMTAGDYISVKKLVLLK